MADDAVEADEVVEVASPVNGTVLLIRRGVGDPVDSDTPVVAVEADGMRLTVQAGVDGVVEEILVTTGHTVEMGEALFVVSPRAVAAQPSPPGLSCLRCGAEGLEPGYLSDQGQASAGSALWIEGPLERGFLGGARKWGRTRREIRAFRCPQCDHLELFASEEF